MNVQPFSPVLPSQSIAASTASASVTLTTTQIAANVVRAYNSGTVIVFIRTTIGASPATVTDTPVAPGVTEIFTKGLADTISAITASGAGTVYFTMGEGQ